MPPFSFSEAVSLSARETSRRPEKSRHLDDAASSFPETVSLSEGRTFQRPEKTRHLGEAAYDFPETVSLSKGRTFKRPEKTRHFDDRACSFSETVSLLGGKRRQSSMLRAESRRGARYFGTINQPTKVIRAYISSSRRSPLITEGLHLLKDP